MKRYVKFILVLISCYSCDDQFVTTQKKGVEIDLNGKRELWADGKEKLDFYLRLFRRPGSNETIKVTVSSGQLLNLSAQEVEGDNSSSLVINPKNRELQLALISSRVPDKNVVLGVQINGHYTQEIIQYKRVCPDQLHFDLIKNEFPTTEVIQLVGKIDLSSGDRYVSDSTRIDILLSDNSLAICQSRVYYSGKVLDFNLLPLGKEGELEITLRLNQEGCTQTEVKRKIIFKNI